MKSKIHTQILMKIKSYGGGFMPMHKLCKAMNRTSLQLSPHINVMVAKGLLVVKDGELSLV